MLVVILLRMKYKYFFSVYFGFVGPIFFSTVAEKDKERAKNVYFCTYIHKNHEWKSKRSEYRSNWLTGKRDKTIGCGEPYSKCLVAKCW